MGYYTQYELYIDHPKEEEIMADLRATNEEAEYAVTEDGNTNNECKWYDHEKHLKEFSKKYPDALFTLWGNGEDAGGDHWKLYVKNGKGQLASGEIVYPEMDESKMVE